jgi:hypothetical protein
MRGASDLGDVAGRLDLPVGYTDPVIGISSWPQTTADFTVRAAAGGGAMLSVQLAVQTGALIPSPVEGGGAAALRAADLSARFARIYYQVMQPDVTVRLSTTLDSPAVSGPTSLVAPMAPIRSQAAAAFAFAATAATFGPALADPSHSATLAGLVDWYGLDWTSLATANAAIPIAGLIAASEVAIPVFAVFKAGDSVANLCPEPLDPAAVLGDPDNTALPLAAGTELVIPALAFTPDSTLSLNAIAAAERITAASLVTANAATAALLRPGFVFRAQGVEVAIAESGPEADTTLDAVSQAFRDNGVPYTAVMAAAASGDVVPGMFRDGASLTLDRYIVQPDETLDSNGSGATAAQLVPINIATVDLFPAGAPLFLEAPATAAPMQMPLGEAARVYAVEAGEILRHNAGAPSVSGGAVVPGMTALPAAPETLRTPYRIPGGVALADIAALFLKADPARTPSQGLVAANAALPGTVAGGQTIVVAGQSLATEPGDSFDDVVARADPPVTLDQLADAIAGDDDALAADALLLCPAAVLPAGNDALTPIAAGARYGLDPGALLGTNAALGGLVVAGQALAPSRTQAEPKVTTVGGDTLNAVVRRFAMLGVATDVEAVIAANPDAPLLRPEALLLLPPPARAVEAAFGRSGWTLPAPIFPLQAWLTLARDRNLVDEAFRGPEDSPGAAVRDVTAVAARRSSAPERQEDGAITLDAFTDLLEAAIPGLRVATGKVLSAERNASPTDIWAVSFVDPGGITKVRIRPPATVPGAPGAQPRSFALRPLSNLLESRMGLLIRRLDPATGGYGATVTLDYQGIDLEVWARMFLADLDLFFTAPYAAPAYRVARTGLETALAAKGDLAGAVADGLSPVLAGDQGGEIGSPNWLAARESLRQQLLVTLSRAYAAAAIIQFEATVEAPAAAASARLSGAGRILELLGEAAETGSESARKAALSNAKTPLGPGTWPVTFLLTVPDESRHRDVELSLAYAINEAEFNVHPVVEGYDSSDWLSFVHPLDQSPPPALDVDLGTPLVPIPLRSYPPLATLASQRAVTPTAPADVDAAVHWSYVFVYRHQSAAQDRIRVELDFNLAPLMRRQAAEEDDLFGRLAQYAAIAPDLWPIFAGLSDPATGIGPEVFANAVDTYAGLVRQVADAWKAHWTGGAQDQPARTSSVDSPAPPETYEFTATLDAVVTPAGDATYSTLTLRRLRADGSVGWPEIVVIKEDGQELKLVMQPPSDDPDARVYDFEPGAVQAFVSLGFELSFAHLHIASYQNASAKVWVERNAALLGEGGPSTRTAFVYRTPAMAFGEPLVPLIMVDARIDIGLWTTDPETNPLVPVFDTIFDGNSTDRQVSVAIRYGYALTPGADPIESYLPVALHPRYEYSGVAPIISATDIWYRENLPATVGGLWAFGISLYSSLDSALDRPLLTLSRLVSPIEEA